MTRPTLPMAARAKPSMAHGPRAGGRVDLDQVVVLAAQHALSKLRQSRSRLLFDYQGPSLSLPRNGGDGAAEALRLICDHMLAWSIRSVAGDTVSLGVEVRPQSASSCMLRLSAANVDLGLHQSAAPEWTDFGQADDEGLGSALMLAANLCRANAGQFRIGRLGGRSLLARAEIELRDALVSEGACLVRAPTREAWLIGTPPRSLESTARRLRHRGWRVRMFESSGDVLGALRSASFASRPGLLLAAEHLGVGREDVAALRQALPQPADLVWLVDVDEHQGKAPRAGISLASMPMSESQLSILADDAQEQSAPCGHDDSPARSAMRVLVVDDDEVGRVRAEAMLRHLGFETSTAIDGIDGINRCMTGQPDAVLMDWTMPRMNGFDATRKLRQLQNDGIVGRFPILALTSDFADVGKQVRARAGLDSVLGKPVHLDRLESRLRKAIAEYRPAQSPVEEAGR